MTTIKPTQRDRDAAERWGTGPVYNMDHLAQAFARHAAAERAMERAAIVEWLRGQWQGRLQIAAFLADTIEAGEHLSDNAEAIARAK
jgi:hypothetical protein